MNFTKIIITVTFLVVISSGVYAETNFDFFFKQDQNYQQVEVFEVRSVDRFVIYNAENKKEIVRMIGLKPQKVPKRKRSDAERDRYGFRIEADVEVETSIDQKAIAYVEELLLNKTVRLEFDSTKKDNDNNTFAYVFLTDDDFFVNQEILRQGLAELQVRPPNVKYKKELRAAYQESRREKRGLQGQ